ncbi:hypothetical protein BDB01DRAFT_838428 [Pilobolus umbonatus]|nr:hypothetical protein BDB01DRAFT_838428 [Pilobolus umbonatus]
MLAFIPLLLVTFIFQAQAFCVHNDLKDEKTIKAALLDDRISVFRRFKKTIPPHWLECCNPSEPTCVVEKKEGVPVFFEIEFEWKQTEDNKRKVECVSGGRVFIKGTEEKYWAECETRTGRSEVPLVPLWAES